MVNMVNMADIFVCFFPLFWTDGLKIKFKCSTLCTRSRGVKLIALSRFADELFFFFKLISFNQDVINYYLNWILCVYVYF